MGGFGGEIRARTPEEAWKELDEVVRPELEGRFGLFLEAPLNRKAALEAAREDPARHFWILDYYFSK